MNDPVEWTTRALNDIEATSAEAWQAVEPWDVDRLTRAMNDLASIVDTWRAGPASLNREVQGD